MRTTITGIVIALALPFIAVWCGWRALKARICAGKLILSHGGR